jgi:hypothetical protein
MWRFAVIIAVALFASALPAAAGQKPNGLTVGFDESITSFNPATGAGAAAGRFAVDGVAEDSGTSASEFRVVGQRGNRTQIEVRQTLVGKRGTITLLIEEEVQGSIARAVVAAHGRFEIVGGTGAYAGLEGHGKTIDVTDSSGVAAGEPPAVTGTHDGHAGLGG